MRIYVAGPYSGGTIQTLGNIRRGVSACVRLIRKGHDPYCPWLDWLYGIIAELSVQEYQRISLAWLPYAEAMLVLKGWEKSAGSKSEIALATKLGIPVFYSQKELLTWVEQQNKVASQKG